MNHDRLKLLGANIRRIRHDLGWTQEKLAELAQMHPVYISYIEKGSRNASVSKILQIAQAMKCEPTDIFRGIL